MQVRAISAAASLVVAGLVSSSAIAASQTWVGATDANWTTPANWSGNAVPGINPTGNGTNTTDVATFNAAVSGGFGSAANPIIVDGTAGNVSTNRMIGRILFDTANVGSFYIGATGGTTTLQFGNNLTILSMTAAVANAQTINAPVALHLPSSTNGVATISNDATSASATLTLAGGILNSPNSTRGSVYTLGGANTGANTVSGNITLTNNGGVASSIIKAGVGTWILSGTNSIVGGTAVNGGTLIANSAGALGIAANAVTVNTGGTLQLNAVTPLNNIFTLNDGGTIRSNGNSTLNRLTLGAGVVNSTISTTSASDVLTVGAVGVNANTNSVTGGTAGTSNLRVAGPGSVVLPLASTYVGNWSIDAGTVVPTVQGALGTGVVGFGASSTGTLKLDGVSNSVGALASNVTVGTPTVTNDNASTPVTLTINGSSTGDYAGALTDGGAQSLSIVRSGTGTQNLSGTHSYTGTTTINGGVLRVNGSLTGTSGVTVNTGATLGGSGTISSGGVTVASGGKITPGSALSNIGTLTTNTLSLSTGSTLAYEFGVGNDLLNVTGSNGLTLNGGALSLFQDGTTIPFAAVGTFNLFDYAGTLGGAVSNLSIANQQAGYAYSFINDTVNTLVKLQITAAGAIVGWNQAGGGSWALNTNWTPNTVPTNAGDSATFGTSILADSTVSLNGTKTVGAVSFGNASFAYTIDQGSGGTLILNANGGGAGITVTASPAAGHTISAPIQLSDSLSNTVNTFPGTKVTLSGAVTGTSGLTKIDTGTLVLTNAANNYGPTNLNGGTIEFSSAGSLGLGTPANTVSINGGTLRYATGNTADISTTTVTVGSGGATIDTNGNNVTFANPIGNGGTGSFTKSGAGTLTVASNTYTGATTINGGTLAISSNDGLGSSGVGSSLTLSNGGQLASSASFALDNGGVNNRAVTVGTGGGAFNVAPATTLTVSGVLGGSGGLTKNNTGTLALSGANTYTGAYTVTAGELSFLNVNATNGNALNISPGAAVTAPYTGNDNVGAITVAGTGTGTFSANNGPGSTFSTGQISAVDAGSVATINLLGRASIGGGSGAGTINLNVGTANNLGSGRYDINGAWATFTGTLNFVATTLNTSGVRLLANGGTFDTNLAGATVNLSGSVPGNALALMGTFNTNSTMQIGALSGDASSFLQTNNGSGGNGTFAIGAKNLSTTFAGTVQNNGAAVGINKVGTGTLTLSGDQYNTNTTTATAGTLAFTGRIYGATPMVVLAGGTLQLSGQELPDAIRTATTGNTLNTVLVADTSSLFVGQLVTGAGIPAGTRITAITENSFINISLAATADGTDIPLTFVQTGLAGKSATPIANAGIVRTTASGTLPGITGIGALNVNAGTLATGAVTQGSVTVASGATANTTTLNVTGAIANNGTLNTTAGGAIAGITGTGTLKAGGGTLNVATGIRQGGLEITGGAVVNVAISGAAIGVSTLDSLTTTGTGSHINVHDNDLVINYGAGPSAYAATVLKVKSGLLSLGGTGTEGITSPEADGGIPGTSLAVVDNAIVGRTDLSGFTIPNPTQSVLVKFTWLGDANLDGVVDGTDYALTDSGFAGGGVTWDQGDYNYSGGVDGTDYALIDTGFGSQSGTLPEPTALGLLGLGAMGMLRRRRRQA